MLVREHHAITQRYCAVARSPSVCPPALISERSFSVGSIIGFITCTLLDESLDSLRLCPSVCLSVCLSFCLSVPSLCFRSEPVSLVIIKTLSLRRSFATNQSFRDIESREIREESSKGKKETVSCEGGSRNGNGTTSGDGRLCFLELLRFELSGVDRSDFFSRVRCHSRSNPISDGRVQYGAFVCEPANLCVFTYF